MANNNAREWRTIVAWVIKKGTYTLHAGTTASDAIDNFISLTQNENKKLVSEAVAKFASGDSKIRVNGYTLRWQ